MIDTIKPFVAAFLGLILSFFSATPLSSPPAIHQTKNDLATSSKTTETGKKIQTDTAKSVNVNNGKKNPAPLQDNNPFMPKSTKTVNQNMRMAKPAPPPKTKIVATTTGSDPSISNAVSNINHSNTSLATSTNSFASINEAARAALVNIICTAESGGPFRPVSGSGVFIDPRGIVLVNAHIGQYFLLRNYLRPNFLECVIRTDSPAVAKYKADLLYISPEWVKNNAKYINAELPTGTGEYDFALLRITSRPDPTAFPPPVFPFLTPLLDDSKIKIGEPVVVAAYPAGFLGGINIQTSLYSASTVSNIQEFFTFHEATLDLLSLGGNIIAQQGSSGGVVADIDKNLVGIVVTTTLGKTTAERDLRAETLSHINRTVFKETGLTLDRFLTLDPERVAAEFAGTTTPILVQTLIDALEHKQVGQ